ncbi:hypothetical protein [Ruminococcus difficilis]|uniref:Uncharacterized protein n=1 Tax=Ruminococcus difficilis TaxID=2763069 RepID=A0A934U2Y2_9FIRM|nr:hypothetical protein [Ruminococcus difficilis]MBK6088544.1 hypothetical protein [Ruminococcus difficilis]
MAMLVDNQKIVEAHDAIMNASKDFASKGAAFIADLNKELSTFEGETKDVLVELKIGMPGSETEGTLAFFVEKQIPQLIEGLGKLLEGNRDTIDQGDHGLAEAIRGGK